MKQITLIILLVTSTLGYSQINIETNNLSKYRIAVDLGDESDSDLVSLGNDKSFLMVNKYMNQVVISCSVRFLCGVHDVRHLRIFENEDGSPFIQAIFAIDNVNYLIAFDPTGAAWWVTTLNKKGYDTVWKFE